MTVLSLSAHATEGGHFYYPDGKPAYTIQGKKGIRPTTKKDAKKLGLYPSVTTIIAEASSYGLENYKINQAIEAALTLPRHEGENSADYIKRVRHDAKEHARIRAEEGTAIHAAIQAGFEGKRLSWEDRRYYTIAATEVKEKLGTQEWECEKSFAIKVRDCGFGGKVDLHNDIYLLDIKSKEGSLDDIKLYDNHYMQISSYRAGLNLPNVSCGILFISTNKNEAKLILADEADLTRGLGMFRALLEYWYSKYKF